MKIIKKMLKYTVEKNFLYLISALLVLIGSFQFMVDADSAGYEEFTATVLLLGILQVYELVLAGVGYSVYKRLNLAHDGLMLSLISLILVFDPTFFNNRLYLCAGSIWQGLGVNLILLSLALGKFYFFIHYTKIPLSKRFEKSIQAILVAIYFLPFFFHYATLENKVVMISLAIALIPLCPIILPRPKKNKAITNEPTLHYRFERYLFFLCSLILPLHLFEVASIYDLPWGHVVKYGRLTSSNGLNTLPWSVTFFAPLLIPAGIIAMKSIRNIGSEPMFHKSLGWFSLLAATFSGLNFCTHGTFVSFITPISVHLVTLALYMILTWSVTGDEESIWHGQLALIILAAGTTVSTISTSVREMNTFVLIMIFANLGLWSLFRGKKEDHRNSALALTALIGKGLYSVSFFSLIENALTFIGEVAASGIKVMGNGLGSLFNLIKGMFNGTGGVLKNHKTLLTFGGAFMLLMSGFYISANKDSLLSDLTDEDNDKDDAEVEAEVGVRVEAEAEAEVNDDETSEENSVVGSV